MFQLKPIVISRYRGKPNVTFSKKASDQSISKQHWNSKTFLH